MENVVKVDDNIIATMRGIMEIECKEQGWWYDTYAIIHVSYDKMEFKTYFEVTDGQEFQMGNEGHSRVVGMGVVELKFTFGKKVTLINVVHVCVMNINLINEDLLEKLGIKSVYESEMLILTRNGVFLENGYFVEGVVKLCTIVNTMNKVYIYFYMIEFVSLWHSRLAHIGINTMKRLIKSSLTSCGVNNFEKYEICVKKPFHDVERNTNLLDLVHSYLCEFNDILTRGEICISLLLLMIPLMH